MKKLTLTLISLLLLPLIIFAQQDKQTQLTKRNFYIFQKPYASKLFTTEELKEFEQLQTSYKKADKLYEKYTQQQSKADQFKKYTSLPLSPKKTEKYKKKQLKYQAKANVFGQQAFDLYYSANLELLTMLSRKNSQLKAKDHKLLRDTINKQIQKTSVEIKKYKGLAVNRKDKQKFQLLAQAYNNEIFKILLNQYLLSISASDQQMIKALEKQFKIDSVRRAIIRKQEEEKRRQEQLRRKQKEQQRRQDSIAKAQREVQKRKVATQKPTYYKYAAIINKDLKQEIILPEQITPWLDKAKMYYDKETSLLLKADSIEKKAKTNYDLISAQAQLSLSQKLRKQAEINKFKGDSAAFIAYKTLFAQYQAALKKYLAKNPKIKPTADSANAAYKTALAYEKAMKNNKNNKTQMLNAAQQYIVFAVALQENALAEVFNRPKHNLDHLKPTAKPIKTTTKSTQKTAARKTKANNTKKTGKQPTTNLKPAHFWTYDLKNPTPVRLRETGTYYRVYIYTTIQKLNPKEFRDWLPLSYQSFYNSKIKKYYAGKYKTLAEAQKAAKELKALGFKAYPVKFVNGKPLGTKSKAKTSTQPTKNNSPFVQAQDISTTKYLLYVIQLGTFSTPKTKGQLKNLSKIYMSKLPDGRIVYYVGPYYKYQTAIAKLPQIKKLGFSDAFITAFNNGKRIDVEKAKELEKKINSSSQVVFRIQVGAFSNYLTGKEVQKYFGKLSDFTIHSTKKGNKIIYSVGEAKTYQDAQKLKNKVRALGYKDAFIIAFKGEKIVPLSEVVKK